MTDQFQKVARKRERISKRARDPASGKFDEVGPLNDPDLLDQCVRWIRAADELGPLLAALARQKGKDEEVLFSRMGAAFLGDFLAEFRSTLLDQVACDPEKVRDARKPLLLTERGALLRDAMKRGVQ